MKAANKIAALVGNINFEIIRNYDNNIRSLSFMA